MAVVIRMKRAGAKKRPFYRIVVADSRYARDGRYIEQLGYYDPLTTPAKFQVDKDRFATWILRGAKASESVGVMMAKHAPEALRPRPAVAPAMPEAPVEAPKPKRAKPAKPAAAKAARKPRAPKKGGEKKAKARAKAKAKKVATKPKKAKKSAK